MKSKYIHSEDAHNLSAPKEIVPVIIKLLNPTSVVDVGCGLGTFLHCFKSEGIHDILGIDGPWVNKQLLSKYLDKGEFLETDLEKEFTLNKKFDLVISLEVAEHLSPSAADVFVKNLVNAGRIILFSAAIPNQGGQNHINEQWLNYWEAKFKVHGYRMHDVLRPIFWDNAKVFWWYRQNMVIVAPEDFIPGPEFVYNPLKKVVHYELYEHNYNQLRTLVNGEQKFTAYAGYLAKSLIGVSFFRKLKQVFRK